MSPKNNALVARWLSTGMIIPKHKYNVVIISIQLLISLTFLLFLLILVLLVLTAAVHIHTLSFNPSFGTRKQFFTNLKPVFWLLVQNLQHLIYGLSSALLIHCVLFYVGVEYGKRIHVLTTRLLEEVVPLFSPLTAQLPAATYTQSMIACLSLSLYIYIQGSEAQTELVFCMFTQSTIISISLRRF